MIHLNGMNILKGRDGSVAYQLCVENLSHESAELQHYRTEAVRAVSETKK